MKIVRPVSDLQNHLDEISKIAHETGQPVFLTKDGHVDIVLMSMEAYEKKLKEYAREQERKSSLTVASSDVLQQLDRLSPPPGAGNRGGSKLII